MSRVPILDPKAVPVQGRDAHLPEVPAQALTPEALRARFAAPPIWTPELQGDGGRFSDRSPADAAVLMPLVMREQGLQVLLTRRSAQLRSHAGQISFPGGRVEPDDGSAEAAALRETVEEIGLASSHIELIGRLPVYATVTSFQVTPVVALVRPGFELRLDAVEVAEAFEVPLAFLMDPAHHQRHRFVFEGGERHFLSMPWAPSAGLAQGQASLQEYFIWGATAAILRNFYRFLSA
ncbi:8-oxo-dGTP pyrophosphatase MutT (NUDIX family) [Paucibacter oligotrophus]|uniref:8-oxo-dGTP pyrophosphatase MutT (NUDIX family) n=1 Tax=Roseateles oligotrophus TaxID=1769250 RepID=A0A840L806_9BURK|nr:CoA pyrophosphatase [Roseateles oligotrophus]MBB4843901.1 8-oxo-dGTP pyrophosphatase MutT (NUDIX family) [Roseateles oligotrophus]